MKTFDHCRKIASLIQTGTTTETIAAIDALLAMKRKEKKKAWIRELSKLKTLITTGAPQWAIFRLDGNSKLPFAAFSSLPGVTCPGAGDCLKWCYSFRAWRYPAAFCRMAQNAHLLRHHPENLSDAFHALPRDITLRLYVDGDFASVADVRFWMENLRKRPDIAAYGYSKSFNELLTYHRDWPYWPKNYLLNLSGGHAHGPDTVAKMKSLPITRDQFDAVSIGRKVKSSDHGKRETNAAIRQAVSGKVFPCPGKCGSCTPKGHACGSESFRGIRIAIAVH